MAPRALLVVFLVIAASLVRGRRLSAADEAAAKLEVAGAQAPEALCSWWGDPHFTTFDGLKIDELRSGKFWIVRHPEVHIQGLFCGKYNSKTRECLGSAPATTRALAFGGPLLSNHSLLVETTEGRVYWDEVPVDQGGSADFDFSFAEGAVSVKVFQLSGTLAVQLPLGARAVVNRGLQWNGGIYMNVLLTMRRLEGMVGACGNFDGNAANDGNWGNAFNVTADDDLFTFRGRDGSEDHVVVGKQKGFDAAELPCKGTELEAARAVCLKKLPAGAAPTTVDECAFDVCALHDPAMANGAAQEEAALEKKEQELLAKPQVPAKRAPAEAKTG